MAEPKNTQQIQAARYGMLSEAVLLIAQTADLPQLLKQFVGKVKWVLDFECCTLAVLNSDGQTYQLQTLLEKRDSVPRVAAEAVPIAQGLMGSVIKSRQMRLIGDVATTLIENALDAMNGSGVLHLRTVYEQETALVEIGDSGPGIPAEIREQIFDPFFTTKAVGKGTGLGLDTVRRIVQRHRGSLSCESAPGDTRFQVRLLLAEAR